MITVNWKQIKKRNGVTLNVCKSGILVCSLIMNRPRGIVNYNGQFRKIITDNRNKTMPTLQFDCIQPQHTFLHT